MGVIETEYWGRKLKCTDCGKKFPELHVAGDERLCDACYATKGGQKYYEKLSKNSK
jgi:hypothetical protein